MARFSRRVMRSRIALTLVGLMLFGAGYAAPVGRAADPEPVALAQPTAAELDGAASAQIAPLVAPPTSSLDLSLLSRDAGGLADRFPTQLWQIDELADSLGDDPARAFAFVRDSIAFEAYPGALRGPMGTLAARAGNALDRAILLAALLDAMLVPYRFAFGDLDDATAQQVAQRTFEVPTKPLAPIDGSQTVHYATDGIALRARRDDALLRKALGDRLNSATGAVRPDLVAEVRHHVWLQVADGPAWVDEDPTMPDAQPGQTLTTATTTAPTIPEEDQQTVTVSLTAGAYQNGVVTQTPVLEKTMTAAEAASSDLFLYFEPANAGLGGTIADVLGQATSYVPVLDITGETDAGQAFPVKPGKDPFTGETSTTDPILASLRLEVTVSTPGLPDETATHVLADRVPPGTAPGATLTPDQLIPLPSNDAGPVALGMVHHIAVSTGGLSPRAYEAEQAVVLDFVDSGLRRTIAEGGAGYSLSDQLWPVALSDEGLMLVSERALVPNVSDGPDVRAYIARPRVWISSFGPEFNDDSLTTTMDLLIDGVQLAAQPTVPAERLVLDRLWYGALESALETQDALNGAASDPSNTQLMSASLSMDQPLSVVDGSSVPADASPAIRDATTSGLLAIVPGAASSAKVWWTVDPQSGETRAVLDPGLGGTYGKTSGAGHRSAGNFPKQGANQNNSTSWEPGRGNGYYRDGKWNSLNAGRQPPAPCGGNEYSTLLGCISKVAFWSFVVIGIVVCVIVYYINKAWQGWVNG